MYIAHRFYYLMTAVILIIAIGFAVPLMFTIGRILLLLLLVLVAADIVMLWSRKGIKAWRMLTPRFSNGDDNPVKLRLESTYPFNIHR